MYLQLDADFLFFFSSRRRHTRLQGDWSSDVCSSDLPRSIRWSGESAAAPIVEARPSLSPCAARSIARARRPRARTRDRKSTRLNSSHLVISYAVFCLKKKKKNTIDQNEAQ